MSNHGVVEIHAASKHMRANPASGPPMAGSVPDTRRVRLAATGVKSEAELYMLANVCMAELRWANRIFLILIDGGRFWSYATLAWLGLCCAVLPRPRAHRDFLPASQSHHLGKKVHVGIQVHVRGIAHRQQSESDQLHINYRYGGA